MFDDYSNRLQGVLKTTDWSGVETLAQVMSVCWKENRQVFLCGNGGSSANAIHIANDFLYGTAKRTGGGLKATALTANSAVITCLANDVGFDSIFSEQIAVLGKQDDLLIVLSGSGDSENIVNVLNQARAMGIKTCAVLGYSGGRCKSMADIVIHFPIDDMQIAEDLQLIVGHMLMQWLFKNQPITK
jgi:D-sedoheptulose 7-phosphate isomerase